jgi:hypothetical protein
MPCGIDPASLGSYGATSYKQIVKKMEYVGCLVSIFVANFVDSISSFASFSDKAHDKARDKV